MMPYKYIYYKKSSGATAGLKLLGHFSNNASQKWPYLPATTVKMYAPNFQNYRGSRRHTVTFFFYYPIQNSLWLTSNDRSLQTGKCITNIQSQYMHIKLYKMDLEPGNPPRRHLMLVGDSCRPLVGVGSTTFLHVLALAAAAWLPCSR